MFDPAFLTVNSYLKLSPGSSASWLIQAHRPFRPEPSIRGYELWSDPALVDPTFHSRGYRRHGRRNRQTLDAVM
jgi:hypothetical protein